ncbi:MAG: hypothetical protein PHE50_08270 [Dehalococcoidales bacterium]|nr:hypothetical protein [Dehalococcoidales bacterium]
MDDANLPNLSNDPDTNILDKLFQEYQKRVDQDSNSYSMVMQITGVAVALFIGIVAYILPKFIEGFSSQSQVSPSISGIYEAVYWLLSTAFVIPYSLVF